jgi:integrase
VILRAALNRAFRNKRVPSDSAWRRVEPFRGTDSARERFLSVAECKRLANASAPDFRRLVQCALATGMRYGELAALRAADFDLASGTVLVRTSKANKFRRVVLNDEGVSLFQSLAAGKVRDALMLTRDDGEPWRKNYQEYPMKAACKAARIVPAVGFHQLRHAYASLAVAAGAPLAVVAENLGHRDARMCERFYRHFEKNYVADTIKATAPSFGFEIGSNVSAIR